MQIITRTSSTIALYAFDNTEVISLGDDSTSVGDPVDLIISDCNQSNASLWTQVQDTPADFVGGKYCFDGKAWTANPDFVEPELPVWMREASNI